MDLTNPFAVVDFIAAKSFPFSPEEERLLAKIKERSYSGESSCVDELHDLRILYWQVIGYERKDRPTKKQGKIHLAPPLEYPEDLTWTHGGNK